MSGMFKTHLFALPCPACTFAPNIHLLCTHTSILPHCQVIVWDWRNKIPTRIFSGHFISVGCCDMSDEGGRVVSGDNHGMVGRHRYQRQPWHGGSS